MLILFMKLLATLVFVCLLCYIFLMLLVLCFIHASYSQIIGTIMAIIRCLPQGMKLSVINCFKYLVSVLWKFSIYISMSIRGIYIYDPRCVLYTGGSFRYIYMFIYTYYIYLYIPAHLVSVNRVAALLCPALLTALKSHSTGWFGENPHT